MKILIVDDEPLICTYIKECIIQSGFNYQCVKTFCKAKNALEYMQTYSVDLVITDLTMPEMDGLAFIEQIHMLYKNTIDIVVLTSHQNFEFARRSFKSDIRDYILKSELDPICMKQLLDNVSSSKTATYTHNNVSEDDEKMCKYSEPIQKAILYIENNYAQNFSLSDISQAVFLNKEYFSRKFKSEVGMNFSEYRLNVQLEKAYESIVNTSLPFHTIANNVGILSDSQFSSAFKKHFGDTPSNIRKLKY